MQLTLIRDDNKSKELVTLPIDQLAISPYNPRSQRSKEATQRLAERIDRNGFEITRALWVYKNDTGYGVFAGGTRLEAARLAAVKEVPCILHTGYSEDDIVGLADEDNENDEYHEPVSVVDGWLACLALSKDGWTQQRIADAKGINRAIVSQRVALAQMAAIHSFFVTNANLNEGHARVLLLCNNPDWLPREVAAVWAIESVLEKTSQPTANQFTKAVNDINRLTDKAAEMVGAVPERFQKGYWKQLEAERPDSIIKLQQLHKEILETIQAEQADEAAQVDEAAERTQQIEAVKKYIIYGDALKVIPSLPDGIKVLFTDPPYGQDFQSNRRVVSNKTAKIANDESETAALGLLGAMLDLALPKMAADGVILIWCSWQNEPSFRAILTDAGLVIKNSIVWVKNNHGSGDLAGTFAPKHERLLFATKGTIELNKRLPDVMNGGDFAQGDHPTKKPLEMIGDIIGAVSALDDIVLDPFCGIGSTLLAAQRQGRRFIGIELSEEWHQKATENILDGLGLL